MTHFEQHEGLESRRYNAERDMAVIVSPPLPDITRMDDVEIPLRDGTKLSANIRRPLDGKPVPLIATMTIYRKEKHEDRYRIYDTVPNTHLGTMRFSEEATFEGPDPAFWVPHGYGVLHVDARGFGKSEGKPAPFSKLAFEDLYDVVEWAAAQPWCDGKVGLSGVSYLGIAQYFTAAMKPPSLKAINPWDARTDRFRSDFLGGIPNTVMSRFIFDNFTIPALRDPSYADELRRFTDMVNSPRLLNDPLYVERVELLRSVAEIEVPALIGASVSDQAKHSRDGFENFMNISSRQKWLYVHRDPEWFAYYDEAGLALQRRFFDHFLKDVDNGWEEEPAVLVKVYENRTRFRHLTADQWPIPGTEYRTLHLSSEERLADESLPETESVTYLSDGSERALFSITFDQDVDLVGHPSLRLWVSQEDGDDIDLFIGLKKFDADGHEVFFLGESGNNPNDIVTRGWLRASHRETAPESTSWRPILAHQRLLPVSNGNAPTAVDVEIHPTATRFRAGERLVLVVQGDSIQPSDIAIGFKEKVNRGRHRVHFGGEFDSVLKIPVVGEKPGR